MTEKPDAALDQEIGRATMKLSLALLVNDLNYTMFCKLPTAHQLALAHSFGLTPIMLLTAVEEIHLVLEARKRALLLRAEVPSTHGPN
jgi:hypothetical protein